MGKGAEGQQDWVFRMYNKTTTDNPPRPNRISFYVFNPLGGEGIGSHFQDPVQAGEWIHVVGIADEATTSIYTDGVFRDCDRYTGSGSGPCHNYPSSLWVTPTHGSAPLRIGTRDFGSFFLGAIREVRLWTALNGNGSERAVRWYGAAGLARDGISAWPDMVTNAFRSEVLPRRGRAYGRWRRPQRI